MPSNLTEALLDVNVLIAVVFADHVHHQLARQFVQKLTGFYTTPTTQGGFLRFATRPWRDASKQDHPPRLAMSEALSKLQQLTAASGHHFIPDDEMFTSLDHRPLQGHRQWTDAYLLHLARKHKISLASLDARMATLDLPNSPTFFLVA